jgi:hypothetical protein
MSEIKAEIRSIAIGILLLIPGIWLMSKWGTNPINSFALIREAEIAECTVLDTYEYWGSSDDWGDNTSHSLLYTFHAPDGREFKKWSGAMWGSIPEEYRQLPKPAEVEYLLSDPSINRFHGEGAQSIIGWVFRDIIGNILLLVGLFLPGVILVFNAVDNIKIMKSLRAARAKSESQSQ